MGRFQDLLKKLLTDKSKYESIEYDIEEDDTYDIETHDLVSQPPIWITGHTTEFPFPTSGSSIHWDFIQRLRDQIGEDTRFALDLPIVDTKEEETPAKLLKKKEKK